MREPIHPLVAEKIREMEIIGVRSAAEVRRHLKTYIVHKLFKGEEPPSELSRRYNQLILTSVTFYILLEWVSARLQMIK